MDEFTHLQAEWLHKNMGIFVYTLEKYMFELNTCINWKYIRVNSWKYTHVNSKHSRAEWFCTKVISSWCFIAYHKCRGEKGEGAGFLRKCLAYHKCRGGKGEGAGFLGNTPCKQLAVLQHTATLAATHCTATHCNTLQHAKWGQERDFWATRLTSKWLCCNTLQLMLQHTATHCSTLQHEKCGHERDFRATQLASSWLCCNTRQHTLQHAVTRCNKLQHTLQHAATHAATRCNTTYKKLAVHYFSASVNVLCVCCVCVCASVSRDVRVCVCLSVSRVCVNTSSISRRWNNNWSMCWQNEQSDTLQYTAKICNTLCWVRTISLSISPSLIPLYMYIYIYIHIHIYKHIYIYIYIYIYI